MISEKAPPKVRLYRFAVDMVVSVPPSRRPPIIVLNIDALIWDHGQQDVFDQMERDLEEDYSKRLDDAVTK